MVVTLSHEEHEKGQPVLLPALQQSILASSRTGCGLQMVKAPHPHRCSGLQ